MVESFDMSEKSSRGNAAQFFVAGELCRRGYAAVVTMGNTPNIDVLCSNLSGTKSVHIQVKTFVPGNPTCTVGMKAERDFGSDFFWVLAGIPEKGQVAPFAYFVIPAKVMALNVKKAHKEWLAAPGKNGRPHKNSGVRTVHLPPRRSFSGWSIEPFREKWDLIAARLR